LFGLPVIGFDRFSSGTGQMNWRVAGLIPVMSASGPDITRSAAGRLAGEMALVPTTFAAASWTPGADTDRFVVTWSINGTDESAELRVGSGGQLLEVVMQRWGNPTGAPYGRYPFGVAIEDEQTFNGVTIGSALRAGWMVGNGGRGFDPYPFILLNLILSCLAAMQGAILLIAARRADQTSAELAAHDYAAATDSGQLIGEVRALVRCIHRQVGAPDPVGDDFGPGLQRVERVRSDSSGASTLAG
jgi:hypothetical protein